MNIILFLGTCIGYGEFSQSPSASTTPEISPSKMDGVGMWSFHLKT